MGYASLSAAEPNPVSFANFQSYASSRWARSVAIGDYTADGRNDIAVSKSDDNAVMIYVQLPDGMLGEPIPLASHDINSDEIMALASGDLNNDGGTDLALATLNGIDVFYRQGNFLLPATLVYSGLTRDVDIADVNADGYRDMVFAAVPGIRMMLGTGSGFSAPVDIGTQNVYENELGDVTGDFRTDIVGTGGGSIYVFRQLNGGTFTGPETYSLGGGPWGGIEVVDVTGDQRQDVVGTISANSPTSRLKVLAQNQSGGLDPPLDYGTYDIPDAVELAQLNGDGLADLVVAHGGWQRVGVYLQRFNGTLTAETLYGIPYASEYPPNGIAVGDINNDGAPDIAIADYNQGLVVLRQLVQSTPTPTDGPVGGRVDLPSAKTPSSSGPIIYLAFATVILISVLGLWRASRRRGVRRR